MTSRELINGAARSAMAVTMLVWLSACGGDDDGGGSTGTSGAGGGSAGSHAGTGGSSGGSGGSGGSAGTSTGGGAGGSTGGAGGMMLPMAMCDMSISTTAECGGTMCPAVTGAGAMLLCTVPCCTADDACGTRNAVMGNVGDCAGPGVEDPSCPGYQGMVMGMAIDLPGCCHSSGKCGAISSISMQCIVMSTILTDLMPGDDCGSGGDNDGGT